MKKRLLTLGLACGLVLSLAACGDKSSSESSSSSESTPTSQTNYEIPAPVLDTQPVELLQFADETADDIKATMHTSMGDIELTLFPKQAPKAVENFVTHAKNDYYNGLTFHRIIKDFMIQGGDPSGNGSGGESIWGQNFEDEFSDSLHHFRGALSMANAGTDTNGSQFFIVHASSANMEGYEDLAYSNLLFNQAQRRIYAKQKEFTSQDEFMNYVNAEQANFDEQIKQGAPEDFKQRLAPIVEKYKEVGGTPHLDNKHTVFGQVTGGMDIVDAIASVKVGENDKPLEDVTITSITIHK